jgi:hypothetical protein
VIGIIEQKVEIYFKKEFEKLNGKVLKLISSSMNGLPDRIVLLPGGRIFFVELKAPGKKPRKLQEVIHKMLTDLGFKVYVIDTKEKVLELKREYEGGGAK